MSPRRLPLALAASLAIAAAGCGGDDADGEQTTPVANKADASLEADFQVLRDRVRIDYRLRNRSRKDLVAFNGVPATETHQPTADEDAVYVTRRSDTTVELAKRLFDRPEEIDLAVEFAVRATVLAPGAQLSERVDVPLPLIPREPYEEPEALPDAGDRVVFCVGVARDGALAPEPDMGTPRQPVYRHSSFVTRAQRLVCSPERELGTGG